MVKRKFVQLLLFFMMIIYKEYIKFLMFKIRKSIHNKKCLCYNIFVFLLDSKDTFGVLGLFLDIQKTEN